jgi:hypothetical protein
MEQERNQVMRRITTIAFALTLVPLAGALADDIGGGEVIQIQEQEAVVAPAEQPVTAPPPSWLELKSTAVAAGLGARFGDGVLLVAGQEYPVKVRGISLGDFGISKIEAEGNVENLEDIRDVEGTYVAVEAGAAAGKGVSTLTMRNEKGVVITLTSQLEGVQLTLGGQGLTIELQ